MKTTRLVALTIALVSVAALFSCGDDDDEQPLTYDCDDELQTNTVDASSWVRDNTDIERYHYASDPVDDIVVLELLDDGGDGLGRLTIEGFFNTASSSGDEADDRQVTAAFERDDQTPVEMTTDALVSNDHADEFRTRTLFERDDTQVIVRSDFKALDCYANEEPDAAGHPCAWPVPTFDAEFSVPSCGFDVDPDFPAAPNLTSVEYRTTVDADPGLGGYLHTSGDRIATFDAVAKGADLRDGDTIAEWLEQTGTDSIIGTEAERLASAAYPDPAWMDHVEEHAATCYAEELEESESELETLRQPHHPDGFACNLDGAWQMTTSSRDVDSIHQPGGGECPEDCADACGKPHLRTFDGSSFPFHAAGEFTMAKAEAGAPFEIQARVEPGSELSCRDDVDACQKVTLITAIATEIGDTRIGVYRDRDPHLVIDGEPVERIADADLSDLPTGAQIHQINDTTFELGWPGGEGLEIEVGDYFLDLHGLLLPTRYGQIAGLWGNYTNISSDDFKTRDGVILEKPITHDEFYDEFADSWRIDADDSMFDYADGESTDDFALDGYPDGDISIADLPDDLKDEARLACSGVRSQPERDWCIFDVVCMCDDDVAHSTEGLGPHNAVTDMHPTAPLTVTGDLCLGNPEDLTYQEADEPTCPPGDQPCIHVLREQSGVELSDDLTVDAVDPGTYAEDDDLVDETIPAGTEVDSYLLHINQVPEGTGVLVGEALCAEEILGIVAGDDGLTATDDALGNPDEDYDDGNRAPDFETDEFELYSNQDGVRVGFDAEERVKEIRVVTRAAQ